MESLVAQRRVNPHFPSLFPLLFTVLHALLAQSYLVVKKPPMNGFITYHRKSLPLRKAREVFSAFKPNRVPIITTLATEFAVFDRVLFVFVLLSTL